MRRVQRTPICEAVSISHEFSKPGIFARTRSRTVFAARRPRISMRVSTSGSRKSPRAMWLFPHATPGFSGKGESPKWLS
ncbi:MAG TPA: hypothetical protein DEP45_14385 [Armatimonadetes bacterium]|nr:hypothetical protein [Armatimonadota bacterium]